MPDLYQILGLRRGASDEDIRSAYRKLAKELHPDRNPGDRKAEERFKQVSAAYEILKDTDRRRRYDRGEIDDQGRDRYAQGFPGGGFGGAGRAGGFRYETRTGPGGPTDFGGFEDILSSIFGGGRAGFGAGTAGSPGETRYEIEVDFVDAARGGKQRLALGGGQSLDVAIPAGIEDGQVLRLRGRGQAGGDALVTLKVRPHPRFRRDGQDILVDVDVPLATAIAGGKVTVPTIDGDVALKVPAGTSSGRTLRLRGRGVADAKSGARGDQFARVLIALPTDAGDVATLRAWAQGRVES